MTTYSFRHAYEASAFHQFQLLTPSKLSSEARERGINCSAFGSTLVPELERLDREGAFRPILFETAEGAPVFRDEVDFVPWERYAINDTVTTAPRPLYSPWQLVYFHDAIDLEKTTVSVDWVLDADRRRGINDFYREFTLGRLESWRRLDADWRELLLLLIRLSSRYGPPIKGSLMTSTVTLIRHPETGEYVEPRELEPQLDAQEVLAELRLTAEHVKELHQRLAIHGEGPDPLRYWHMLIRMAPARQRARLRGVARRAQDAYDGCEMIRHFYYDLTGELLLNPDEIFDVSDKSWKRELFGEWPTLSLTRADLAVELRRLDLHPHQVHLAVEGDTEEIVCRRVLEGVTGRRLNEFGISIHRLHGNSIVLQREMLNALKQFPRYVVLIADREGTIGRDAKKLIGDGVLTEESTLLWERSFEESNFSDEELVELIGQLGAARGATLQLDHMTLRALYEEHRDRAGENAQGLATFALSKATQPAYGSVRASKTELADLMAQRIIEELNSDDVERVQAKRPIVAMLLAIFRVT